MRCLVYIYSLVWSCLQFPLLGFNFSSYFLNFMFVYIASIFDHKIHPIYPSSDIVPPFILLTYNYIFSCLLSTSFLCWNTLLCCSYYSICEWCHIPRIFLGVLALFAHLEFQSFCVHYCAYLYYCWKRWIPVEKRSLKLKTDR